MKKRILALALAGTTAFSVFGAAMSASAAYIKDDNGNWIVTDDASTHVWYENDEYVQYSPVATKITASGVGAIDYKDYYTVKKLAITTTETLKKNGKWTYEIKTGNDIPANGNAEYKYVLKGTYYYKPGDGKIYYVGNQDADDKLILDGISVDLNFVSIDDATGYDQYNAGAIAIVGTEGTTPTYTYEHHTGQDVDKLTGDYYLVADGTADLYVDRTEKVFYYDGDVSDKDVEMVEKAGYKLVKLVGADANVVVNDSDNYSKWVFNGATTADGEISLSDVVTYRGNNGKLVTESVYVPTIFAYDYIYNNNLANTAANVARVWNDSTKTGADVASAIGVNTWTAERGSGSTTYGVRADVIADWVDFLDELAINHDNGYRETREEFLANYKDIYANDPVYNPNTGALVGYNPVDLYNLDQLLNDIYDLSAKNAGRYGVSSDVRGYYNANTSEMVYLMQQYNKYFNDYVNKEEVATGEWGEFLLEILNAAEADDFKKSADYKKYVNRVEDLADAYEEATTVNMIREAELGMYDLLTDLNGNYRAAGSVDKAELSATMESLYFNIGTPVETYTTAPSTSTSKNVDYKTYNYYVATATRDSVNDWYFTTTLTPGYYSLYPMADYVQTGNTVAVYNGNKKADDYTGTATDEYQWFWNVYQLAYNMKADNTKQGSIDAIDAALNEAVAALEATKTPYATETSALEEMVDEYAGKIDTDYNAGYYAKYTQANDFAEVAEGKYQTRVARYIVGVAGEALTYQGTQITVTKNDIKSLNAAITDGKNALKAIKEDKNYNAAQVNALNKAIDAAQDIVDQYNGVAKNTSVNKVSTGLVGDKDQFVKSDLTNAIDAINSAIDYSEIVMGWSKNDAGKWMYGTEDGYLSNGWNKIGSVWYYFNEDGTAKQSEWMQLDGKWYWFNSNAGAAIGWAKVDGQWYYFGGNNAMKTGWQKVDGSWYYLASSGRMITGWAQVDGKWYYMSKESNSLGQMLANTTTPDGYKVGADGAMLTK